MSELLRTQLLRSLDATEPCEPEVITLRDNRSLAEQRKSWRKFRSTLRKWKREADELKRNAAGE